MIRALIIFCICIVTSSVMADARYRIHPTDGEFVKTAKPCGAETRDELYTRVITFVPTLIVTGPLMILSIKGNEQRADQMIDGDGWWNFDGKQSKKSQVISLKRTPKETSRAITISVIRHLDELECAEQWIGTVQQVIATAVKP